MSYETTPLVLPTTTTKANGGGSGGHNAGLHDVAIASQSTLTTLLGSIQAVLLVIFMTCTKLVDDIHFSSSEYIIFRDIMVMLLLGFGYLMTFLSKYGLGAVGYVPFCCCCCSVGVTFCSLSVGLTFVFLCFWID
jgi:hypothetical protein